MQHSALFSAILGVLGSFGILTMNLDPFFTNKDLGKIFADKFTGN